jgi:hypothetical protein
MEPGIKLPGQENQLILHYNLDAGYSNDFKGTYVHPKLINSIILWVSVKHMLIVSQIMDAINEVTQYEGQTFEKVKDQILEAMKKKIEKLVKEGKRKDQQIIEQELTIKKEKKKNHDESVRSEDNNKKLCIFQYENGDYFISANQTLNKNKSSYWYSFPSAMHIRKLVVKQFKIKNFNIPKESINKVNEYILSLNPKDNESNTKQEEQLEEQEEQQEQQEEEHEEETE